MNSVVTHTRHSSHITSNIKKLIKLLLLLNHKHPLQHFCCSETRITRKGKLSEWGDLKAPHSRRNVDRSFKSCQKCLTYFQKTLLQFQFEESYIMFTFFWMPMNPSWYKINGSLQWMFCLIIDLFGGELIWKTYPTSYYTICETFLITQWLLAYF